MTPIERGAAGSSPPNLLDHWEVPGGVDVAWDASGRVALVLSPARGAASWRDTDRYETLEVRLPGRGEVCGWVHDPLGRGVLVGIPGAPLVRLVPGSGDAEVVIPREVGSSGFRVAPDGSTIGLFERGGDLSLWGPGEERPRKVLRDLDGDPSEYALGPGGVVLRARGAGLLVVASGA